MSNHRAHKYIFFVVAQLHWGWFSLPSQGLHVDVLIPDNCEACLRLVLGIGVAQDDSVTNT